MLVATIIEAARQEAKSNGCTLQDLFQNYRKGKTPAKVRKALSDLSRRSVLTGPEFLKEYLGIERSYIDACRQEDYKTCR